MNEFIFLLFQNDRDLILFQFNLEPIQHSRLTSPLRSSTPQYNPNGSTRPTSPAGASPLRQTVAITNTIRSRDVSREREPLDFTDLEGRKMLIIYQ